MLKAFLLSVAGIVFIGTPNLGCEKKISEDTTVHQNPDGSKTEDSTTVKKDANGNTIKTQEHKTTP